MERSAPKSEGRKRLTPAATAAFIRTLWPRIPGVPTVEITASWPLKAAATASTDERSAATTLTDAGSSDVEDGRLSTVMLNLPDLMRALATAVPRFPAAYRRNKIRYIFLDVTQIVSDLLTPTRATFFIPPIVRNLYPLVYSLEIKIKIAV